MNRKNFLRNVLMTAAISICPKNLWPSFGEIESEEKVFNGIIPTIEKYGNYFIYNPSSFSMETFKNIIDKDYK